MVLSLKNTTSGIEKLLKTDKVSINTKESIVTIFTKNDGVIDAMCTKKNFEKMVDRLLTSLFYERKAILECTRDVIKEPCIEEKEPEFIYFVKENGDWREIVD